MSKHYETTLCTPTYQGLSNNKYHECDKRDTISFERSQHDKHNKTNKQTTIANR